MPSIFLVTDVRYWHRRTGAQQRIYALAKYLAANDFNVTTVFTAPIAEKEHEDDHQVILDAGLNVISLIDDWQPANVLEKVQWKAMCVWNAVSGERPCSERDQAKHLADFESPALKSRFAKLVNELQPDIVIVEYVTLAYLLPERRKRQGTLYALDTHDLLSDRCQQFKQYQFSHWLEIDRAQEAAAFAPFDILIAIQSDEAAAIREMAGPDQQVILAGHPAEFHETEIQTATAETTASNRGKRLGYFASNNAPNFSAIEWLLTHVWENVLRVRPDLQLQIAGSVCEALTPDSLPSNVHLRGFVEQVEDFYDSIDVVVNPIQFGTGLKIKNIEALSFGKPLISSPHGTEGLPREIELPWLEADSADDFASKIIAICSDEAKPSQLQIAAKNYVQSRLNADLVFAHLMNAFRS